VELSDKHGRLTLKSIAHPNTSMGLVRFFKNESKAVEHMVNHLLTEPESRGWSAILEWSDLASGKACARLMRAGLRAPGELQQLYDVYSREVEKVHLEAVKLGWIVLSEKEPVEKERRASGSPQNVYTSMGLSGVITIVQEAVKAAREPVLKTAFLAGAGRSDLVARRLGGPAGAKAAMGTRRREPSRTARRRQEWKKRCTWDPESRYYYEVFRPAVKFVRSSGAFPSLDKGNIWRTYWRLIKVLPALGMLKKDYWIKLCKENGRRLQMEEL